MRTTARRGAVLLLLVAIIVSGLSVLAYRFYANGEEWATMRVSQHITKNGSFIAAGNITDRNGELLAHTENEERIYNDSERIRRSTLHIVGDTEGYISSGVQTAYKKELIGYNLISGVYSLKKNGRGNDIRLTIDSGLCAKAYDALGDRKGVIAAYNYKTGELLCSVSGPSFDIRNKPEQQKIDEDSSGKYDGIYMNRLIDGLYTPGSVFKIITTAAAIKYVADIGEWDYTCNGEEVVDGVQITCPSSHGHQDFGSAFTNSCNCAYAVLSEKIGAENLEEMSESFGFGKKFKFGKVKTEASLFDLSDATAGDAAWAAVGQYNTLVNPYHMLTVLGSIANNGKAVLPYAVSDVTKTNGKVISTAARGSVNYITPELAEELSEMMRNNVENKYGDNSFPYLSMCGKTGTAEVSDGESGGSKPHSWFMGFSQNPECPVAVVVVVENGGWGSSKALPIASLIMNESYKLLAE